MKVKTVLSIALCSIACHSALAQPGLFAEAFQEFSSSRLWEFEEIPIDWKMEGILQADLNDGLNYLLENNPKIADVRLTTVIGKNSSIWQAYYYRAAARKLLRKFGPAQKDMELAIKLRGDFYEGFVELAKIFHLSGQVFESDRAIDKALRLDKKRGTAYYLKGDISMSKGEIDKAIDNYTDCLVSDSLFHNARIKLALIDLASKNGERVAIGHLDRVLSYDSLQQHALLFRGLLNCEKNKTDAIRDLSKLVRVNPNNLIALYYRGLVAAELEEYERAFRDFQKVIKATSTSDNNFVGRQTWMDKKIDMQNVGAYTLTRVYGLSDEDASRIKQAYCHIITGRYEKCHNAIDQIFNYKKEPVAVYLKAVAYEHQGVHVLALDNYNRALKLDDQIADAYKKRGIYEQELKEWGKSIEDFSTVLKLYPDAFRINWIRGLSYYHMKQFSEAIADFNIYLKNDSLNNEVLGARGMAYLNSKQPLRAYADFAGSGNLQAVNYIHADRLVDSVLQLKDTLQALYCVDVITKKAPYFSEGFVHKFKIHLARNQWEPIADNISVALSNLPVNFDKAKHSYLLTVQGLMYARNGHTNDAIKSFNEAIKIHGQNDIAYLERGRLFFQMRKSSKAESDFKKALALGNERAKEMLASIVMR